MSAAVDLDDVFAFCVMEQTALHDVWAEIENTLCHRDKQKPPKILVDMSHTLFRDHGLEIDLFTDSLSHGVWADIINDGGRFAIVIGTQQNVCVCGELELLDALADVCDASDAIRIMSTTQQALRWLQPAAVSPVD